MRVLLLSRRGSYNEYSQCISGKTDLNFFSVIAKTYLSFLMLYHDIDFCLSCVSISFRFVMKTFLGTFFGSRYPVLCTYLKINDTIYSTLRLTKLITHDLTLYCANDRHGVCKDEK